MELIKRLTKAYRALRGDEIATSQQDSYRGFLRSSPSQDHYTRRWIEPYERIALINQIEELLVDLPILESAVWKFVQGALGHGSTVTASHPDPLKAKRIQRVLDKLKKRAKLDRYASSMGLSLLIFGDVFVQPVIDEYGEISKVVEMPTAGMERLSDDTDRFQNPKRAFLQRDTQTRNEIAIFSIGQIIHGRHLHRSGRRYGESQLFAGRRIARDVLEALYSLLPHRKATQAFRHYDFKGPENSPLSEMKFEEEIKSKFSRRLHIEEGKGVTPFDDVFTTNATVEVLGGDPHLDKIADIEILLDSILSLLFMSRQLLGFGTNINRDVLDEQRAELYVAQAQFANEFTEEVLTPIYELAIILNSLQFSELEIFPEEVKIKIEWGQQYTETQMVKRVREARADFQIGGLTLEEYRTTIAPFYKLENLGGHNEKKSDRQELWKANGNGKIQTESPRQDDLEV